MKTKIYKEQHWAVTGRGWIFGVDLGRGFYVNELHGNLDAPVHVPVGSTVKNEVDNIANIIGNVVGRDNQAWVM